MIDSWYFIFITLYFKLHDGTTTSQQGSNRHHLPNMIYWGGNTPLSNTIQTSPEGEKADRPFPDSTHIIHLLLWMSRTDRLWIHLSSTPRHSHSCQSLLVTRNTTPSIISVWWVTQQRSKLTWRKEWTPPKGSQDKSEVEVLGSQTQDGVTCFKNDSAVLILRKSADTKNSNTHSVI